MAGDLKDNYSKSPVNSNTARLGMDYFPSKKTIIGFVVNGNFNNYRRNNDNSFDRTRSAETGQQYF